MKQGAYDYLFKPLDLNQLRRVVGDALEVARRMRAPAVGAETQAAERLLMPRDARRRSAESSIDEPRHRVAHAGGHR
jgi:DNA-binding NtrC family response regulator